MLKEKVISIVGPTGIGKTKLSIELAKYLNTEIINGDAIQIFKEGDILSAKPSLEEREGIKHYLLDERELDDRLDIASFKKNASELITKINKEGKIPIIVGGSGLYIKALLYDYDLENVSKKTSDIDKQFKDYTNEQLFAYLENIDKEATLTLHPNNRKRVLRAIDIALNNPINKSEFIAQQKHEMIYDALVIGLKMDRDMLYNRINERVDKMITKGLLNEVTSLALRYGLDNDYQLFQAIGFKEFRPYFDTNQSLEMLDLCIEKLKQNSRRYAKKQITWFNNQMKVNWLDVDINNFDKTIDQAKKLVGEKYEKNTI